MGLQELFGTARDTVSVRRVFAEPYESGGVTVIAAARVTGGAGGGGGREEKGAGGERTRGSEGEGGGIGLHARPAGVYVVKDGAVTWVPALDPTRIAAIVASVAAVALASRAAVEVARARAVRRHDRWLARARNAPAG